MIARTAPSLKSMLVVVVGISRVGLCSSVRQMKRLANQCCHTRRNSNVRKPSCTIYTCHYYIPLSFPFEMKGLQQSRDEERGVQYDVSAAKSERLWESLCAPTVANGHCPVRVSSGRPAQSVRGQLGEPCRTDGKVVQRSYANERYGTKRSIDSDEKGLVGTKVGSRWS
jgi:hypothetical protein